MPAIVTATLMPPPKKCGVTHWSTRLLARHLGISDATVAKAWRDYGVQPWRSESFRFSTDPELVAKVVDVVGLYLDPPENAIVLSVDEKSQIQALDRTSADPADATRAGRAAPPRLRPARDHHLVRGPGDRHRQGHRRGQARHRHQEFLAFLKQVARAYPGQQLHLVMDNYAAHKHPAVKAWLAANPRVVCHFTPTHASWMNLVEVWFSLIERQAIHRGSFGSVNDLNAKIRAYIDGWNNRCHPFVWTKTADEILKQSQP